MLNSQPNGCFSYLRHYFMVVLWRLIPFALCLILGVALYVWEQPTQGNCNTSPETCIKYPDWVHGIGILLILIVVTQIPIWAVITSLYYLCAPSKRFLDVVRPTKAWGPGNKEANRSYQRHRAAVGRAQGILCHLAVFWTFKLNVFPHRSNARVRESLDGRLPLLPELRQLQLPPQPVSPTLWSHVTCVASSKQPLGVSFVM